MRRVIFTTLGVFLFSALLSAQTVDQIVASNIAAKGGMAKLKSIQSLRITGDSVQGPVQANLTQVYKRPLKMRTDVSIRGLSFTQAYDGQNGWQIVPLGGRKDAEALTADDAKHVAEEADFDGPLMDYKQKGNTVELVGKEQVAGKDAYHLKVTLKSGGVSNVFLDAQSFLAVKVTDRVMVEGVELAIETTLSDYRDVEGVMFPFSIESLSEEVSRKINLRKVEINIPVEDSIFRMPASAGSPAGKTGPALR